MEVLIVEENHEVLGTLRREEIGVHAARAVGWTASPDLWRFSRAAGLFDAVIAKPASLRALMRHCKVARAPTAWPRSTQAISSRHASGRPLPWGKLAIEAGKLGGARLSRR